MPYTYDEALSKSLEYFNGDELAAKVFVDKYALRNSNNELLEATPTDMHWRIAKEFARIEANKFKTPLTASEIFALLDKFKYIVPQGSPMYGIGNKEQYSSLGNCFLVKPPDDSYGSILATDHDIVQISKFRGGCGVDISNLRPEGTPTHNAAKTSSGTVSFANRYSNSIREVGQCVAKNSFILTYDGLKYIQDVKIGDRVWTKNGWKNVVQVFNNGYKNVYEVTTKNGYKIQTTLDHIFSSNEDGKLAEKKLADLQIGHSINLIAGTTTNKEYYKLIHEEYIPKGPNQSNRLVKHTLPTILNEDFAYLLGFMYGNAYICDTAIDITVANVYTEVKSKIQNIIYQLFNCQSRITNADGQCENISICSTQIIQFLRYNNICKQKANNLTIPNAILQSPSSVQLSFISGYFDADGDVAKKGSYRISSVSLQFLESIQLILSANGILSKIRMERKPIGKWQPLYRICINGGFFLSEARRLLTSSYKIQNILYKTVFRDSCITPYKAKTFNTSYGGKEQYLSASSAIRLNLIDKNGVLIQNNIVSINPVIEIIETYDLQLDSDSDNMFWCNGFYIHNSGRRGAIIITLSVHHPDVLKFASCKLDKTKVTGANISLRLTDEFMNAVENNTDYEQRWPVDKTTPKISKMVNANQVWEDIVTTAHKSAEPGLLFWDRICNDAPHGYYPNFRVCGLNPCGEISFSSFETCRLMVLNLYSYIINPFSHNASIDIDRFYKDAKILQRLLDDLVDLDIESIDRIINKIKNGEDEEKIKEREIELWEKIRDKSIRGRRCGGGLTGLGDTLAALGLQYGSDESIAMANTIYKVFKFAMYTSSIDMAEQIGCFSEFNYEVEKDCPFFQRMKNEYIVIDGQNIHGKDILERMSKHGRRNIGLMTSSPCGTISLLTQTTSGIEPVFEVEHQRKKKGEKNDPNFKPDYVDKNGDMWATFKVLHPKYKIYQSIPEDIRVDDPYINSCSSKINWLNRVKLQSNIQSHIDHSISSTLNLPKETTVEQVKQIYWTAWKHGCKGITVYVEGSRDGVLTKTTTDTDTKRPRELPCDVYHISVKTQAYFVLVGLKDGKPYEVFAGKDGFLNKKIKTGRIIRKRKDYYKAIFDDKDETELSPITATTNDMEDAITRLVSTLLRSGTDMNLIVTQLERVNGEMNSFAKSIARALKKYIIDGVEIEGETCPECGGQMIRKNGCHECKECQASKCI